MQNRFALFFLLSFLIFCSPWAKTLCFEGESPGGKIMKKCQKLWKSVKNYETILPFSCCPLVFPWKKRRNLLTTGRWGKEHVKFEVKLRIVLLCPYALWTKGHREKLQDPFSIARRRTNMQQLTCKINLPFSFYYLFFSFILLELKPFVLKGKVLGEKLWKSVKKCRKVWKILKRFCPLVVALLYFPWHFL